MMKTILSRASLLFVIVTGQFAWPAMGKVIVVLSSNLKPYQEAFAGFEKAYNQSVSSFTLTDGEMRLDDETAVIVAIGGKAAVYPYPAHASIVYCLALGTIVNHSTHRGPLIRIDTAPSLFLTVSKFKELQPNLKHLSVLWSSEGMQDYMEQKKEVAQRLGVDVISVHIENAQSLPDHLRAMKGKVEALWMTPDASLVTPKNFSTIKEFSYANGIPFYVPTEALVEQGGFAAVYSSFEEIGSLAAKLTKEALHDGVMLERAFPETAHIALNLTAAKACHLDVSASELKQVEKTIP